MKFQSKTLTECIEEIIQSGCCGAELPAGLDWQGAPEQVLQDACQSLLNSSAAESFYSASLEDNYLSIA